jgi:hypothetical protein
MYKMEEDIKKVKGYLAQCIESLEKHNFASVCSGYSPTNDGGRYDRAVQRHARKIVDKLVSLGYVYTTNHGFGCCDWRFEKDFEI